MLYDAAGSPVAPPEIERRLKQVHDGLTLRWMAAGAGDSYWAVCCRWEESDPRWQRVQSGQIPESQAVDMVTMLPVDCPVSEAYGYFVNGVRAGSTTSVRRLLDRVEEWNREAQDAAWEQEIGQPLQAYVEAKAAEVRPFSAGGLPAPPKKKRR